MPLLKRNILHTHTLEKTPAARRCRRHRAIRKITVKRTSVKNFTRLDIPGGQPIVLGALLGLKVLNPAPAHPISQIRKLRLRELKFSSL